MRASPIEFRLRMLINATIIILGFWAPWIELWHIGRRISLLEWLALEFARMGIASFSTATTALLILAGLIAAKGVLFRVWGTAYLGTSTVNSMSMVAGKVMAEGPYPLYAQPSLHRPLVHGHRIGIPYARHRRCVCRDPYRHLCSPPCPRGRGIPHRSTR